MSRPKCCRRIDGEPACRTFKAVGVPWATLKEVVLTMDEFEAVRLADLERLYHEQAAARMNVSRQTFGRILEAARGKIARVLVEGLALRIAGGAIEMAEKRAYGCRQCHHQWSVLLGSSEPAACPACLSGNISCAEEARERRSGPRCRRSGSGVADGDLHGESVGDGTYSTSHDKGETA